MGKGQPQTNIPFLFSAYAGLYQIYSLVFGYFSWFYVICYIFFKINFFEKTLRNTISMSNGLDPDQVQHFVWPDLGTNCLQR